MEKKIKISCLIDGEHYLPNIKDSLREISRIYLIKYLIFIGGTEKIGSEEEIQKTLSYPIFFAHKKGRPDPLKIGGIIHSHPVKMVLDLSDEPVVDYKKRFAICCEILKNGTIYKGADFEFWPLDFKEIFTKPSLAIWGTGKRIGKTAFGGFVGRILKERGFKPIILTLSRGGPTTPILVRGDEMIIDANYLLDIQNQGLHASSDCFEDALTARVPTLGCRRCGGGMSGKTMVSLIEKGARMAEKYKFAGSIILEGSGASVPEIKTDKVVLLMDITQPKDILEGYLTPLKVSYADLIVLTMCEDFLVSQAKINQLIKKIRLINPKAQIATTVLRPFPLQSIKGKKVFWTTTAQSKSVPFLKKYIEETYGCSIVGMSAYLSNQPKLKKDMAKSPRFDLVITELKAAAISVVAREAVKQGKGVVFLDNMITLIPKGGNVKNLKKEVIKLISSNPK